MPSKMALNIGISPRDLNFDKEYIIVEDVLWFLTTTMTLAP